jgi:glycosyltransferase involved in cell wall biosynthesis
VRIAQVAPLAESVPPARYGGTERVVSYLTEELVRLGHDVTLFASGDSVTSAHLVPVCPRSLWQEPSCRETLPHHVRLMEHVFADVTRFDILHFHTDYLQFPLLRREPWPSLTTLHGFLNPTDVSPLFGDYAELPLISISDAQRRPLARANWIATIHHGLPEQIHTFGKEQEQGGYLAFLGRVSPEKRLDRAIEIARRSQVPLKVAAKIYPEEQGYFDKSIEPLLEGSRSFVEFVGEIGGRAKDEFLRGARALLFPIDWEEPFGLVMIEAMACGTPVIAWRRGSIPEIVDHGVTGFVVDDTDEAVSAVRRIREIDRSECRSVFERRFGASRMARQYVDAYLHAIEEHHRRTRR